MDSVINEKELEKQDIIEAKKIDEIVKNNLNLLDEYPVLEMEYNRDGTKKSFYILANEKNIKETQLKSDENELDFSYSQNKITKEAYERQKNIMSMKLIDQNLVYDNLIFEIIKNEELEDLKEQVRSANLNEIDLQRLASSLSSIAENKIDEFQRNNKEFKEDNVSYWNYKYDVIAKNYAKIRELESFILSMIK